MFAQQNKSQKNQRQPMEWRKYLQMIGLTID